VKVITSHVILNTFVIGSGQINNRDWVPRNRLIGGTDNASSFWYVIASRFVAKQSGLHKANPDCHPQC
jgi:hypothetical protein